MPNASKRMTNINTKKCYRCFGAQHNGIGIVSEFFLRPSDLISSVYVLHSVRGQLLDIGTQDGFIVDGGCDWAMKKGIDIRNLRPFQNKDEVINALSTSGCESTSPIRLDIEPDWEGDPSAARLSVRTDGILRALLSISCLIYRSNGRTGPRSYKCKGNQGIHHYCPGPETISELLLNDVWGRKWYYLPFEKMIRNGQLNMGNPDSDIHGSNWIVRIHDALTLMLALRVGFGTWAIHITDCLGAALFHVALHDAWEVIIIIYEESHNRLLESVPEDPKRFHSHAINIASTLLTAKPGSDPIRDYNHPGRLRDENKLVLKKRVAQWILPPDFRHALGDLGLEIFKIMRMALNHGVISSESVQDILTSLDLFNVPTSMGLSSTPPVGDSDTVARCRAEIMDRTLNQIRYWRTQNPDYDAWAFQRIWDEANFPLPPPPPTTVKAGSSSQQSPMLSPPPLKWTMVKREQPDPSAVIELPFHGPPIPAKVVQAIGNDEELDNLYYDPEIQNWVIKEKVPEPYNPLQQLEKTTDYDESVYAFLRSLPGSRYFR